jgi:hypothetical protein
MNRSELEGLDRDALIVRAEALGVARARILTRPELIDELLVRAATREASAGRLERARGFFGRARDLLARVVEKGLHLPEAAEIIRAAGPSPPPPRTVTSALPTVTLAEIYATQGHKARAVETLRKVLEAEPDHAAARGLLAQLEDPSYAGPKPRLPPEEEGLPPADAESDTHAQVRATSGPPDTPSGRAAVAREPFGRLDDEPHPRRYHVDECVAIPVDPTTMFVSWEVKAVSLERARARRPGGCVVLRVLVIVPTWEGPRTATRDHDVHESLGDFFVRDVPTGAVVRVAVGWRAGEVFQPFAHSDALETPHGEPSAIVADSLVRWTPKGPTPLALDDPAAAPIVRALGLARARLARARRAASRDAGSALGASEHTAVAVH